MQGVREGPHPSRRYRGAPPSPALREKGYNVEHSHQTSLPFSRLREKVAGGSKPGGWVTD